MKMIKAEIARLRDRNLRVILNKYLSFPGKYNMRLVLAGEARQVILDGGTWSDAGRVVVDRTVIDVSAAEAETVLRVLNESRST